MKFKLICIYLIISFRVVCQPQSNNEWLSKLSENSYIKVTLVNDGIYQIPVSLISSILPTNYDENGISLYNKGVEIPLRITKNSSGGLSLEFFGYKNDGSFDSLMYFPKSKKVSNFNNFYTYENNYFIFYEKDKLAKRITNNVLDTTASNPVSFFYLQKRKVFDRDWNYDLRTSIIPYLLTSHFEENESLMSKAYKFQTNVNQFVDSLTLDNLKINTTIESEINLKIGSRYNSLKDIKIEFDNITKTIGSLSNFDVSDLNFKSILSSELKKYLNINIIKTSSNKAQDGSIYDAFSILYYDVKYPSNLIFSENEYYYIPKQNSSVLDLTLEKLPNNFFAYNVKDKNNPVLLNTIGNSNKILIKNNGNENVLFIGSKYQNPISITKIEPSKIVPLQKDYLILTTKKLETGAEKYKLYRESIIGGNYKVFIKYVEDIYNEYSFGEYHPTSISKFISEFKSKNDLKYILILGRGVSHPTLRKTYIEEDLVPSFGFPASDLLLTSGFNPKIFSEKNLIPTGRLSIISNQQIEDYLVKLKAFESRKIKYFSKNFLMLSGGRGESQVNEFRNFMFKLGNISKNSFVGANNIYRSKTTGVDGTEKIDISNEVNKGLGMITFFGHSSPVATDLNMGYASDQGSNINNSPNYPFMFFNGCAAGNVFSEFDNAITQDWVTVPNKGAIAILAHSYLSYSNSNYTYMEKFYKKYLSSNILLNSTIGNVIKNVNIELIEEGRNDIYLMANVQQMVLQGDPAIQLFNMTMPDFQTEDTKLFLTSTVKSKALADGDSLKLGVIIANYGIYEAGTTINLNLKKTFVDGKSIDQPIKIKAVAYQDTILVSVKKDLNLKSITITVDNDKKINEIDETNNTGLINFNWEALKNTSYYSTATLVDIVNPNLEVKLEGKLPLNGMKTSQSSVLEIALIDENSFGNKTDKLEVSYRKICDSCPETLTKLDLGNISGEPNEIKATIRLTNLSSGEYEIFIQGYDAKKNSSGDVFTFKFNIVDEIKETSVRVYPNPMSLYTTFEVAIPQKNGTTKANYNINIYNQMGLFVKTIIGDLKTGLNDVYWDAKDNSGNSLPAGQYFYKMMISKDGVIENKGGKIRVFQ